MTGADVEKYRRGRAFPVVYKEETGSTNDLAKEAARQGVKEMAFVASRQTAGRGRKGRSFVSPEGGLYLSYLFHPTRVTAEEAVTLTTAACVAVADAIEKVCGIATDIKWVNDLYVRGRKVCGILAEAVTHPETGEMAVILGVGVNLSTREGDFPPELRDKAGSLYPTHCPVDKGKLTAALLDALSLVEEACVTGSWLGRYRERSLVLGKEVCCFRGEEQIQGLAEGIDEKGGLILRTNDGTTRILRSGEVTLRMADGV